MHAIKGVSLSHWYTRLRFIGKILTQQDFDTFAHEAVHQLMDLNDHCSDHFKIGQWPRWDYDLDAETLTFSDNGIARVVARIDTVGTTSLHLGTWMWAWANDSLPHKTTCRSSAVRAFGEEHQIAELINDVLPDDEYLGWKLTAVAARLLGAQGAYRCPDEDGFLYVVYRELKFVD